MTPSHGPSAAGSPAPSEQAARDQQAPLRGRAVRRQGGSGQPRPLGPAGGSPSGPAGLGPRRAPRDRIEDAQLLDLARQFAAAYLEIEAGRRGAHQLMAVGWARASARPASLSAAGAPGRVVSVVGARTLPGRFDAVAVVRRGPRFGALAIRLAQDCGTWVVDDARCPEHVGQV